MRVADGQKAASLLADQNVEVLNQRGDIAIVAMSIDDVETIAALDCVKQIAALSRTTSND